MLTSRLLERARLTVDEQGRIYRDGMPCPCSDNGYGYLKCRSGNHTFKVHQVAAEQFLGGPDLSLFPMVEALIDCLQWDVAHKDRNKRNNSRANLAYVPHSFNMRHESPLV